MKGYNGTVFSYGQTGSGASFAILFLARDLLLTAHFSGRLLQGRRLR